MYDVILVGGGLQSGLIALALRSARPNARIAVFEQADRLGGDHTWCFSDGDVSEEARKWIFPLVAHSWPARTVAFPNLQRTIPRPYHCVPSDHFSRVVTRKLMESPRCQIHVNAKVVDIGEADVTLESGEVFQGRLVVDARGLPGKPASPDGGGGFQKFLGLEFELATNRLSPPLALPILMDATVAQTDGFRFFYILPFSANRVLIEDTYYADSPDIDANRLRDGIREYALQRGFVIERTLREESGVLPIRWTAPGKALAPSGQLVAGYRGGWFHPTTGYSFGVAARFASLIANAPSPTILAKELRRFQQQHRCRSRFFHFLNRLWFRGYPPEERWRIMEWFYRLDEPTIERFGAMELSMTDYVRFFARRPPPRLFAFRGFRRGG